MTRFRNHSSPALIGMTVLVALTLSGCAGLPGTTASSGSDAQFQPSWDQDRSLAVEYAAGVGDWWTPPLQGSVICGVADGVALLMEPRPDSGGAVPEAHDRSAVVGIRMADNEELWRIDEAACTSDESVGDAVYVAIGPYRGDSVIERVVIATGERTPKSTALDRLELSGVITELEDVTLLTAYQGPGSRTILALDGTIRWQLTELGWLSRCEYLDGGPIAAPGDARLGCNVDEGYALVDTASGEVVLGPNPLRGDTIVTWARDGYLVYERGRPTAQGEWTVTAEQFDLEGNALDTVTYAPMAATSPARHGMLLPLDEVAAAESVTGISPTGDALLRLSARGRELALSGTKVDVSGYLLAVSSGGEVLLFQSSTALTFIDAQGTTLSELQSKDSDVRVVNGYLVKRAHQLGASVLLPAPPS
ncbi:hypothetical protein EG850_05380 [Gulosibacter macacae]|uniref:Uncharacterized protein n=1 Tax=Gulosibacter macacae TaxID=2488791 RepID=A0A3P3W040_9MICO|nr:hypothetical protein [Gulosibacter macacae]RRJ87246.1 hypothetical protein EG850_05380 [Gulosibacter macacae]